MRIRELLAEKKQSDLKTIEASLSLLEAAQMLSTNNIGALPVVDADLVVRGILSERDVVRSVAEFQQGFFGKCVFDVMTTSVVVCHGDDLMDDVYGLMTGKNIRHIPVVENRKLHDMLSIRDFEYAYRKLKSQALSDSLTGLHNQHHLLNVLDGEFNRYRRFRSPLSVAAVHVDEFGDHTDNHGHTAADNLLLRLAGILTEQTRAYDSLGRTGDDRFAIIFPNTDAKSALRACERVLRAVRSHTGDTQEEMDRFSVSIGLAHADHNNRDGMSIMKLADERADVAIASGGDCIEAPASDDTGPSMRTAEPGEATRSTDGTKWGGAH